MFGSSARILNRSVSAMERLSSSPRLKACYPPREQNSVATPDNFLSDTSLALQKTSCPQSTLRLAMPSRRDRRLFLAPRARSKDSQDPLVRPRRLPNLINHAHRPLAHPVIPTPFHSAVPSSPATPVSSSAVHPDRPRHKRQPMLDHGIFQDNILA